MDAITSDNAGQLERLAILEGHTNRVSDLEFSADGVYLASTGYDELIRLWDLETLQQVYTFPNPEADLNTLAFSPDGSLLASGEAIWDIKSREPVQTLEESLVEPGHVGFSPDGSKVVVYTSRTIKVWDVVSGKPVQSIAIPAEVLYMFNVAFSPDGNWLAAGSSSPGTVYFWSAETGELVSTLVQENQSDLHAVEFSSNGSFLASGGAGHSIDLWHIANRELVKRLPTIGLYSLAISQDDTLLAAAGPSRSVDIWDVETGRMIASLRHADELMAVAFSPDGKLIATGGYDNKIALWGIPRPEASPSP
jgi:WD40 repeat protein